MMQTASAVPLHRSRVFKSSLHCMTSPDGRLVAIAELPSIHIRSTGTLQTVHVVKLPQQLTGQISALIWSPSSTKILVSAGDQIHIFSACDTSYHATVTNPAAPAAGKASMMRFGITDSEVLVCAPFGLKLAVFDMSSSKVVEISNPKFHQPASATRGFAIRPATGHLAILTRVGGKDMVSIHLPTTRQVLRSWCPDSLDAQEIMWTPDGQWLLLWESAVQGRKLIAYTADGQHFRTMDARSLTHGPADSMLDMELGIRSCQVSPSSELCAIGDHSRAITVLRTGVWRSVLKLSHPTTIVPRDTLQIWQEQLGDGSGLDGGIRHSFVKATQMIAPPAPAPDSKGSADAKTGCPSSAFDASSTLLATRLDDAPCTLWIWDLAAAELRAVIIFHSAINFAWHARSRETLLITCQEGGRQAASYVWDPLTQGPTVLKTDDYLPKPKFGVAKLQVSWLNREAECPELLMSDSQHFALLSLADAEHEPSPWDTTAGADWTEQLSGRDDVLSREATRPIAVADASTLDDTFSFRYT